MVIHDHHASKKKQNISSGFSVFLSGGSLRQAEVGHFRKAPKHFDHFR
jgi:hypothetical protein